ncbi:GNAT family N-acetyltransferase [Streptomyces sp. SL54]|uniref:GNAT family N-acetyltransferase n=2 Tax=Streptantibioticus silvisoli TaxID=2705255 RepID=A0ABT6VYW0_9ACTN|nr:GNAT family N-acetyltransferase [Streptantibioticus silvisoli]
MPMSSEAEIRYITAAEAPEFVAGVNRGFLRSGPYTDEQALDAARNMLIEPERTLAAFDGRRIVGTFRSIPREMTVPGGATLPASGVTGVTVTATHRRRGLLTRMMDIELAAAVGRGEPVAILIAAEYRIYGRYGFGPAAGTTQWSVDIARARTPAPRPADGSRIDLVTPAEVRAVGPELFDRVRRATPGANARTETWWRSFTGDLPDPGGTWREPFFAVYRDASGRVDGLLTYTVDDSAWAGKMPDNTLTVDRGDFATPQAETALWRYALSMDWLWRLRTGLRACDDVLPLLLGDPRAATVDSQTDYMWLRVLDVPTTLAARTYNTTGSLVLRLRDPAGYADGTFRLDASPEPGGSTATATTEDADLAMDIAELGTLYLGDESAVRLAALGRVTELRPGAAARADLLLRTSRRPWCPDTF